MASNNTNTVRLHRVLRAKPERVYRAFLDPDAMVKWLASNGFTGKVHQADAKLGGTCKMSFPNFSTGTSHSFGGEYLELKPNEILRYTDKFDNPDLPGEMITTTTLKQVLCGTELNITQAGIPAGIPAETFGNSAQHRHHDKALVGGRGRVLKRAAPGEPCKNWALIAALSVNSFLVNSSAAMARQRVPRAIASGRSRKRATGRAWFLRGAEIPVPPAHR